MWHRQALFVYSTEVCKIPTGVAILRSTHAMPHPTYQDFVDVVAICGSPSQWQRDAVISLPQLIEQLLQLLPVQSYDRDVSTDEANRD